jgi:hypothetical protein
MNKLKCLCMIAAITVAAASIAVPSDAAPVGAQCVGTKLKATGKRAQAKLTCHKKAARQGVATDAACLTTAENKFAASFARAETKPPCYVIGDAAAIAAKVDAFVSSTVADLRPAMTASACASGQLSATGKKAGGKMNCHMKGAKKGLLVDPGCLLSAEEKFDERFAKAVGFGDCLSASTAATIEASVDALVADVADDIRPGPLSKCSGRKLERTGQKQLDKLKCHADAAKDGITVDPVCLTDAEAKFDTGFTDAETYADCLQPTGDAAAIEGGRGGPVRRRRRGRAPAHVHREQVRDAQAARHRA